MTVSIPTSATVTSRVRHRLPAVIPAVGAAALLFINGVLGLVGDVDDHTSGSGMFSELTAGAAFLAGATALVLLRPRDARSRIPWGMAIAGLTLSGGTMLGVTLIGAEPAEWLFLVAVLPSFIGMLGTGVVGVRRVWPWWTGAGVALFLPVMFVLPFNSFVMAAIWLAVGLTGRPRGPRA